MKNNTEAQATEQVTEQTTETGLAVRETQAIAEAQPNAEIGLMLAELQADIESTIKELSVDKLTAAGTLLNKIVTLNDAFSFDMTIDGETETKVLYVVSDNENTYFVAQNPNANRLKFVTLFDKVRTASAASGNNKQLALTNVRFETLEHSKGKAGNKPIALMFTKDTKQVWI